MYIEAYVKAEPDYRDECPVGLLDGKLSMLDGMYSIDAYGTDSGIDSDCEGDFHYAAVKQIIDSIRAGIDSGETTNGVVWQFVK